MTQFSTEQNTDQPDRIFVEVDRRFEVAVIRTEEGLELRIYPRTEGAQWDAPFVTFTVDEDELMAFEKDIIV